MGAGVLIPLEQYLATDDSPDREFVDGVVTERCVGELPRSFVQRNLVLALCQRHPGLFAARRTFTGHRLEELLDGQVVTDGPQIRLDFAEIFRGL